MRAVMAVTLAATLALLAGCSDSSAPATPAATPSALGGELRSPAQPPARPMNLVERTIADDLSGRLAAQGLSVDHLECPEPDRRARRRMTCDGYVDGVLAAVHVRLWGPSGNRHYDARLGKGMVATANLVRRLAAEGYHRIDCGARSAYPSRVGSRIVCSVTKDGRQGYVVATITTDQGEVEIGDY